MQLRLSCYCCGGIDFKRTEIQDFINIEDSSYLLQESVEKNKVICEKCGLEDYIFNLPIRFY